MPVTVARRYRPIEVVYAEITSNFSTASTTYVDVTNLATGAFTIYSPAVVVVQVNQSNNSSAAASVSVALTDTSNTVVSEGYYITSATFDSSPIRLELRIPAGTYAGYKVRLKVSAGTGALVATTVAGRPFVAVRSL